MYVGNAGDAQSPGQALVTQPVSQQTCCQKQNDDQPNKTTIANGLNGRTMASPDTAEVLSKDRHPNANAIPMATIAEQTSGTML